MLDCGAAEVAVVAVRRRRPLLLAGFAAARSFALSPDGRTELLLLFLRHLLARSVARLSFFCCFTRSSVRRRGTQELLHTADDERERSREGWGEALSVRPSAHTGRPLPPPPLRRSLHKMGGTVGYGAARQDTTRCSRGVEASRRLAACAAAVAAAGFLLVRRWCGW